MYIPKHFSDLDQAGVIGFMAEYSFGTIVTANDNVPLATHLPFVVSQHESAITLTSHFAKANDQWVGIEKQRVLVIFSEPHAYISPKHYDAELSVPTWNYRAVHAYGMCQLVTEENEVFDVLEKMVDTFERDYRAQWNRMPLDYKIKMSKGIVAFRILVDDLLTINKLSQNKNGTERRRIIDYLGNSKDSNECTIARFMEQNENTIRHGKS